MTPLAGMDSNEVDVRLAGPRLRQEPDEEPDQRAGPVRREAGVREVLEEEPGQHGRHRTATPPVVDHCDHGAVVGRAERPHRHDGALPRACIAVGSHHIPS